ncbi:MAG TPA: glycerophosphodiester phosphodiesterase family protein [Polyangiales bacterium]|nr:glycerophosphodiester phosphodiesterase family protein [Polyangiales bacterium]
MRRTKLVLGVAVSSVMAVSVASADGFGRLDQSDIAGWVHSIFKKKRPANTLRTSLGPRPFYLVNDMDEGPLKEKLLSCTEDEAHPSEFSIAHRGAPLQFPEHTKEAYLAGLRMGAGVMECDVAFTKDKELVCRHAQCDLHTTTNILAIPELAAKCTQPFKPADAAGDASALCCTSDITLDEFKSLCGKMDASNPKATTVAQYLGGTASFRTDLYSTCGTVLTHKESLELFDSHGAKFTPELKTPTPVKMPFDGFTQEAYAQKLINEYKEAGIAPRRVFPQSFLYDDIKYWIEAEPAFGKQAVYLDERVDTPEGYAKAVADMAKVAADGVKIIAPPSFALVSLSADKKIVPSDYAIAAKQAGLDIITWSLERSGPLATGGGYYYGSVSEAINNDGDQYTLIDVLAQQVGVRGIFSDWPATTTFYANCFGL